MSEAEPIRIVLTPEQRELVRRISGTTIDAIDLTQDEASPKAGGPLHFRWRLSNASGIPRTTWAADDEPPASPPV